MVLLPCSREGAWSPISPSLVGGAWMDQRRWPARPHPKLQRLLLPNLKDLHIFGRSGFWGEGWWGVILTFHSVLMGFPEPLTKDLPYGLLSGKQLVGVGQHPQTERGRRPPRPASLLPAYGSRASSVTIATGPPGPTRVTKSTRTPLGEAGAGHARQTPQVSTARARGRGLAQEVPESPINPVGNGSVPTPGPGSA